MRKLVGILLILVGIGLGIYVGFWWALVGGIVSIIEQVGSESVSTLVIAGDILRVLFSSLIGYVSVIVFIVPGIAIYR